MVLMHFVSKKNVLFLKFQTGTTALFFAAQAGYVDVAKILVRYGARIDAASLVSFRFFSNFKISFIYPIISLLRMAVRHCL